MYTEAFSDDRNQHINADGDPDLGFDRVLVGAEKCLDAQMLLDPFEEQLDNKLRFSSRNPRACFINRYGLRLGTSG